jgi:predicted CoA-substrate-specific enzyme activase
VVYRLGIDAGSKTIKLVLLDDDGAIAFSQYRLHRSDIITTMRDVLHDVIWRFGDAEVTVCITGSAGMRLAELFGAPHVQEVISTRHALGALYPKADVAIELGGEDAKIIYLSDGIEQRMNGACAGGTGGFIDLMTAMLGVTAKQFNMMALGYQTIYPIASRCAVFAQADVRPLLNEGAHRNDIAASILQAVVTQTIAGLSCGRPIRGTVVFLGGPFEVYSELVSRFRQTLGLSFAQTIKPPDAHLFVARGAALLSAGGAEALWGAGGARGAKEAKDAGSMRVTKSAGDAEHVEEPLVFTLQSLLEILETVPLEENGAIGRLDPLFATDEELAHFRLRHAHDRVRRARLMNTTGDLFIGIDAGSTTVKLAVVNKEGELLYSQYEKSKGEVLKTAQVMLDEFYTSLPREYGGDPLVNIRHVKVCGYGERLLQTAFEADSGVVETIAHLRAAQELEPEVDFVLDIGGQDIKCMRVREGAIDDIMLNESCSSGCGALIEGFSRSLGFTKWTFSDNALAAKNPVDLGTRCTVFMTSRVRHAQKEGVSVADIAAGLAYSVVRNALYKVIGCSDPSLLGRHVVVQGGTFKSDAVLRAFELESGLEVIRPDIAELMGAYGAALLARDECGRQAGTSTLLNSLELASLKQSQSTRRCQGCANNCLLTISSFSPRESVGRARGVALAQRALIAGNRCERVGASAESKQSLPNLIEYEQRLLASRDEMVEGDREGLDAPAVTVGIPGVLDLYETYPFWGTFFSRLGMRVIRAYHSSLGLYQKGAHAVMSEGVCYPAKLAHGHVEQLIERGADLLFMPTGGAVASAREGVFKTGQRHTIECPVSSNYAQLIAESVAESYPQTHFLTCDLALSVPLARQLLKAFARTGMPELMFLDERRIQHALDAAAEEQEVFYGRLATRTAEALALLDEKDARGIVLAGHPYHVDPGMSHGVDSLIADLGLFVFSASGILALSRRLCDSKKPDRGVVADGINTITGGDTVLARDGIAPVNIDASMVAATWTQPAALYELAHLVARHERLDFVQIYSFGCGVDALSVGQVREMIEGAGKLYTALKMDEMVDLATIRIRLRSLVAALTCRSKRSSSRETAAVFASPVLSAPPAPSALSAPSASLAPSDPSVPFAPPASPTLSASLTFPAKPLIIMPALAPQHLAAIRRVVNDAGYRLEILPELATRDIDAGLRFCNNDLCHPLIAVAGQVIEASVGFEGAESVTLLVPQLCCGCRAIELEQVIRRQLATVGRANTVKVIGIPSRNGLFTMPAWLATRIYDELAAVDVSGGGEGDVTANPISLSWRADDSTSRCGQARHRPEESAASDSSVPLVGVIGTPGLLYTPQLNRDLLRHIERQGCRPYVPRLTELLTTNAPLEHFAKRFAECGILDIICVQSFGCLTGHINGRGAAQRLRKRYPEMNISFIDYDSGTSEVNQQNRIRLALAIAKERTGA